MIAARTGRPFRWWSAETTKRIEIAGDRTLSANDATACLAMGLTGLGVVHALTFLAAMHIESGALEPAFSDWWADAIPVYVVYPPNRHLSAKVRVFVDWLATLFAKNEAAVQSVIRT